MRVKTLPIYPQRDLWRCGPFALKHAMLMYDIHVHEDLLVKEAKSIRDKGTWSSGLKLAARRHGFDMGFRRCTNESWAKRELDRNLRQGTPVIIVVDEWLHWMTVLRKKGNKYIVADSDLKTVIREYSWAFLKKRLFYEAFQTYDLHPLRKVCTKRKKGVLKSHVRSLLTDSRSVGSTQ